jgi:cyclic pyranopterin phosphate synthase
MAAVAPRSEPSGWRASQVTPVVTDRLHRQLRDLRISVTDRCNLRCCYCRPPSAAGPAFIARSRLLSFEQIVTVARACAELGVRKIRLTGGEPLLRRGLPRLVELLADIPGIGDLAVTTNGLLLAEQAAALAGAGLRRVTVSLDSLDDAVFGRMNGVGGPVARVVAGIRAARAVGLEPVKINSVIRRGVNDAGIVPLARFARDEGLILRMIEYMDTGQSSDWRIGDVVSAAEMLEAVAAVFPLGPARSTTDATATCYPYRDGAGEVGVIGAVTRPFCGDCTRVRLTADGHLYTCLFAGGGHDLRDVLASGVNPRQTIDAAWHGRDDRYSTLRTTAGVPRAHVDMYRVGG